MSDRREFRALRAAGEEVTARGRWLEWIDWADSTEHFVAPRPA